MDLQSLQPKRIVRPEACLREVVRVSEEEIFLKLNLTLHLNAVNNLRKGPFPVAAAGVPRR
jgi:hypothetical protein